MSIIDLWPLAAVLLAAIAIAWGAEAGQFLISQGLALAILAWFQTLPEFTVEAVIAWEAGKNVSNIHLVTANFTGSLRLLTGLGWPMIYATAAYFYRRRNGGSPLRKIVLEGEHAVEVITLLPAIAYFFLIYFKSSLTLIDSTILIILYLVYLFIIQKIPPQSEEKMEDMEFVPRKILQQKAFLRNTIIFSLFIFGGLILYFSAHPFFSSMLRMALMIGISEFIFIQWLSPFLSEFPEKVSALYWARKITGAPMALMNMVSSNINQWTILVAMIPIVYSFSRGGVSALPFDPQQEVEILLTILQSFLGFLMLANMEFAWYEAIGLFFLWFVQFIIPGIREEILWVYGAWIVLELGRVVAGSRQLQAFNVFARLFRGYVLRSRETAYAKERGDSSSL